MGLTRGSYEAYCLDQAAWFLGITIDQEIEKVGQNRSSEDISNEAARKRVLARFLGESDTPKQTYADPAAFFLQG